jgi:hypothetical protein
VGFLWFVERVLDEHATGALGRLRRSSFVRHLQILGCLAILILVVFVRASRGDVEPEPVASAVDDTTEPITGDPVVPIPGSEQPMRDPFASHEIGAGAGWTLDDLNPDEQDVALRGVDSNPQAVQDAYAGAARDLADRARAEHPAAELGILKLGEIGVVP